VTYLGAVASRPSTRPARPREAGPAAGQVLEVPVLSQRNHTGRHPEWGGGGDVWCSPAWPWCSAAGVPGRTAPPGGDVHDPVARDPATIRRVYRRGQFEYAWRAGSGGVVYVMHTATVVLPHRSTEANW
jgi:hypothetical protein